MNSRVLAGALMVLYAAGAGIVVLSPNSHVASVSVDWVTARMVWLFGSFLVTPWRVEFISNAILFMPLTLLGTFLVRSWSWVTWTVVGFVGSLSIEILQYGFLSARSAQVADVVSNTLGAFLGAWLGSRLRSRMRH
jgi:glycopeptide antibiotics resistance protein